MNTHPISGYEATCAECRQSYVVDGSYDAYVCAPYYYDRDDRGLCIGCFLGVGPHDRHAIEKEIEAESRASKP